MGSGDRDTLRHRPHRAVEPIAVSL